MTKQPEPKQRERGTKEDGSPFEPETIEAVWRKGTDREQGTADFVKRRDGCGAWISRDKYGKREDMGWELDHIIPVSKGGKDNMENLQALHWQNNVAKSDHDKGDWKCAVT